MSEFIEYMKRFRSEIMYLYDGEEEIFLRSDTERGYFAKFPGYAEYSIKYDSPVVMRAVYFLRPPTREEYERCDLKGWRLRPGIEPPK